MKPLICWAKTTYKNNVSNQMKAVLGKVAESMWPKNQSWKQTAPHCFALSSFAKALRLDSNYDGMPTNSVWSNREFLNTVQTAWTQWKEDNILLERPPSKFNAVPILLTLDLQARCIECFPQWHSIPTSGAHVSWNSNTTFLSPTLTSDKWLASFPIPTALVQNNCYH